MDMFNTLPGMKYMSLKSKGWLGLSVLKLKGRQVLRRVVLRVICSISSVGLILRRIVVTLDSGTGQWTLWGVKPNLIWGN